MNTISRRISVLASALTSDAREAPNLARRAGFHGLLFDAFSPMLTVADLSQSGRREFRRLLAAQAQTLVGLQMDPGPGGFGPGADLDRLLARIDKGIEAATELGAGVVCIDLGALPAVPEPPAPPKRTVSAEHAGLIILPSSRDIATVSSPADEPAAAPHHQPPPQPPPPPDPRFGAQVGQALSALGAIADRYRATIAFSSSLAGFAAIEHAIRAAGCPWFGIDLDPVAMLRDRWHADQIFSRLGPLLRHVRARDAVLGADRRTKPVEVGRGQVKWPDLLASLDDAGYDGWITIDPIELANRHRAAEIGLAKLRAAT